LSIFHDRATSGVASASGFRNAKPRALHGVRHYLKLRRDSQLIILATLLFCAGNDRTLIGPRFRLAACPAAALHGSGIQVAPLRWSCAFKQPVTHRCRSGYGTCHL